MKQVIVLASFIALGIFISSIVLGFKDDIKKVGDKTVKSLNAISNEISL